MEFFFLNFIVTNFFSSQRISSNDQIRRNYWQKHCANEDFDCIISTHRMLYCFRKKSFRWRRQSNVYQSLKDFPLISKFDEEICETDLIRIHVQFINQCDNLVAWPNAVVHLSFHVICYPVFCKSESNKQSPKHEY